MKLTARTLILSMLAASTLSLGTVQSSFAESPRQWTDPSQERVKKVSRRRITARSARRALRHSGFREIREIDYRGRAYIFTAIDRRGRGVRIKMNAFTGDLISVRPDRRAERRVERRAERSDRSRGSRRAIRRLKKRGFHDFTRVRHRRGLAIFKATGPRGERVRFKVDKRSGRIVRRKIVGYVDSPRYDNDPYDDYRQDDDYRDDDEYSYNRTRYNTATAQNDSFTIGLAF